jgi:cell wall-associated NlpC family hydrolase
VSRAFSAAAAAVLAAPLLIVVLFLGVSGGTGAATPAPSGMAAADAQAGPGAPTAAGFVAEAKTHVGAAYVFGGKGPDVFDCSGLVWYSLAQLGIRTTAESSEAQWAWVTQVPASALQPGDLIFEDWPGDTQASPSHVVIYAGDGKVVEAPQPGQDVWVRPWSPDETTIVGYGQVPGLRY